MINKHKDTERLAEELMKAFGKEMGTIRENICETMMDQEQEKPLIFSDNNDSKQSPVYINIPYRKRRLRRGVTLVAAIILVLGLALVAEGVNLNKSTVASKPTEESVRLFDINKGEYDVEDFEVTNIPEDYEVVEDITLNDGMRLIEYKNSKNKGMQIHISKKDAFGANVDNERTDGKTVLVNDHEAHLFNNNTRNIIVWQIGDCTIDITSEISEEEIISVAKKIYVK